MSTGRTVTVRDEAGNLSLHDVPSEDDVYAYKFWTEHLESGRYVIELDPDWAFDERAQGVPEATDGYPAEGNIGAVIDWVRGAPEGDDPTDGWLDRAGQALTIEQSLGDDARKGILTVLEPLVTEA